MSHFSFSLSHTLNVYLSLSLSLHSNCTSQNSLSCSQYFNFHSLKLLVSLRVSISRGSIPCYGCTLPPSYKLVGPTVGGSVCLLPLTSWLDPQLVGVYASSLLQAGGTHNQWVPPVVREEKHTPIRALVPGMLYAICCLILPSKHKKSITRSSTLN